MRVVVRIGGSVVASPLNVVLIDRYANLLKVLYEEGNEVVSVIGGGTLARDFIRAASELGLNETNCDWIAIYVSRLFAQLFIMRLDKVSCRTVPISLNEAVSYLKRGKIVVMGGLNPGMTTDTVAAMMGEKIKADLLVKASDVEGIFTKDPKKCPNAKKIDKLGFKDLERLLEEDEHKAGIHQILDPKAIKILQKRRLKMVIVNGFNPENVLAAIRGEKVGTAIHETKADVELL